MENKILKKYNNLIVVLLGAFSVFLLCCLDNREWIYGDASGYNIMSNTFVNNGLFNFGIKYDKESIESLLFSLRGYAWPWLIALFKIIGFNTVKGYYFVWALFIAIGFTFVIPELFSKAFGININGFKRLIPLVIMLIFWRGVILYPLSDIPSIIVVSLALLFVCSVDNRKKLIIDVFLCLVAGFLCGFGYYIRSGCKYVIFFSILYILLYKYQKKVIKKIIIIATLLTGLLVSALPQIKINEVNNDKKTYEVPIFFTTNTSDMEFYYGLSISKYETSIGGKYSDIVMSSTDKTIDYLLNAEKMSPEEVTLTTIPKLFLKYPQEMLGIYARKFGSSLDIRYCNDIYLDNVSEKHSILSFLNLLLVFCGVIQMFSFFQYEKQLGKSEFDIIKKFFKNDFIILFALSLPGLIHLIGTHIETRYLLPNYVLLYYYISCCDWKQIGTFIKKNIFEVMLSLFAVLGCVFAIWNSIIADYTNPELVTSGCIQELGQEFEIIQDFNINYNIIRFEVNEDNYLNLQCMVYSTEVDNKKNDVEILLINDNGTYFCDEVRITKNMYIEKEYENSMLNYNKDLSSLNIPKDKYYLGFIIKNGDRVSVCKTEAYVELH